MKPLTRRTMANELLSTRTMTNELLSTGTMIEDNDWHKNSANEAAKHKNDAK